jgi:hypothetical protein
MEEAWLVESFLIKDGVLDVGVRREPSKSQGTPCLEQFPQTG